MVSVSLETEHMLDQLDLHLAPSSDSTVTREDLLLQLPLDLQLAVDRVKPGFYIDM